MVALLILPATTVLDIAMLVEVFGADGRASGGVRPYELRMCAAAPGATRIASGFTLDATHGLHGLRGAHTVLVPAAEPDVTAPASVLDALRRADAQGARIVAIGSGLFALAASGLLAGRRATAHWRDVATLRRRHPDVELDVTTLFTRDGRLITAAGAAATLDLCLQLVNDDQGAAAADAVARRVLSSPQRAGGRPQLVDSRVLPRDDTFDRMLEWALARLDQPLALTDLARVAGLSQRTLARRFHAKLGTTPVQWLLGERLRLARRMLETTDEPIGRVARIAGFGSAGSLRQQFVKAVGVAPGVYRRSFNRSSMIRAAG
ncbi:GlxA family transcriptional regulator [Pseudonocardia sp. TRM90224]|uniref:GlxA family transcriptional regulator n=1 Tax=Pseudonocardia sp. TRM90224 TaxID=2812678 RepID=UPI001E60C94F|nr:helix-turn-helix domain-containing protein [Pseudonocardia sp. TRM90224]